MYRRRKEGLAILLAGLSLTVMLVLLSVAGLDGPAHADPAGSLDRRVGATRR